MNKQRHRRPSQGGTSPETTPQTRSGVAHFSVSEVVQFSMSVDKLSYTNIYTNIFSMLAAVRKGFSQGPL